jgi:hypothetical protein
MLCTTYVVDVMNGASKVQAHHLGKIGIELLEIRQRCAAPQ